MSSVDARSLLGSVGFGDMYRQHHVKTWLALGDIYCLTAEEKRQAAKSLERELHLSGVCRQRWVTSDP